MSTNNSRVAETWPSESRQVWRFGVSWSREVGCHHQGPWRSCSCGNSTWRCALLSQVYQPQKKYFLKRTDLFSNLLHTSGPNVSSEKRWNLVLAYNQVVNAPYHNTFLQRPEKIDIVEDGDVVTKNRCISTIDKKFIVNKEDNSTEKLEDET